MTHPTVTANVTVAHGETKYFVVRAFRTDADESRNSNIVKAVVDSGGSIKGNLPNAPHGLSAVCLAGAKVLLSWVYSTHQQEAAPTVFNVYHNAGSGAVDYATIVATMSYEAGRYQYEKELTLVDATTYLIGVRASTASDEEENTETVQATADGTAPAAFTSELSAETYVLDE